MRRMTDSSFIGVSGFHKPKVQIKYICVYLYYLQQRDLENPDFILFKLVPLCENGGQSFDQINFCFSMLQYQQSPSKLPFTN